MTFHCYATFYFFFWPVLIMENQAVRCYGGTCSTLLLPSMEERRLSFRENTEKGRCFTAEMTFFFICYATFLLGLFWLNLELDRHPNPKRTSPTTTLSKLVQSTCSPRYALTYPSPSKPMLLQCWTSMVLWTRECAHACGPFCCCYAASFFLE
jgi:hypothetical protein